MKKALPIASPQIKDLMAEHKVILQGLGVLRVVTERIEKRRQVALTDLRFLERFFKVYADSIHHHAEESLLFDPLAEIAPKSLRRMMEQLVTQHVMGRFLVHRISEAIDGAATGLRGWRKKFVSSAQAYDTLLSCHICSEDHHVFPIADRLIEKRSLRIKAESTPTLKQRILLEKSLSRLVSRYGVADQSSGVFQNCDRNTMR
ncbi:MAG: hemerythrin domain-containing protein [bacterium]|nr:hemerythrin domain-containing protein [bacterium]